MHFIFSQIKIKMPQPDEFTWQLLEEEARKINSPEFIAADPVQFPRRFSRLQDVETAALLCSSIAWGNRTMICRDCDRMLALMGHDPYNFSRHGSVDALARDCGAAQSEFPAWHLAEAINTILAEANEGTGDSRCLPLNLTTTALKRLNMALRWLVRDDGIVDMGVWSSLKPSQLYIPLDVHVGNTARALGLVDRRANDRRTAVELTSMLRSRRPADPVWFDYALFGIGINKSLPTPA